MSVNQKVTWPGFVHSSSESCLITFAVDKLTLPTNSYRGSRLEVFLKAMWSLFFIVSLQSIFYLKGK